MSQFVPGYAISEVKDEWETPDWLFIELNGVFKFTLDAAANRENAKVRNFYSIDNSGLENSWESETVFCNPPWTRGAYAKWIKKAFDEFTVHGTTSVLIVPFKPEVRVFSRVWNGAKYMLVPEKRIKYYRPKFLLTGDKKSDASAPTMATAIPIFTDRELDVHDIRRLTSRTSSYLIDIKRGVWVP